MATRQKVKAAARQANADKRPRACAKYVRMTSSQGADRSGSDPRQARRRCTGNPNVHAQERIARGRKAP